MAAPDPLALLVPEDSPESWDSPDPREPLYVAPLSPLGLNSRLRSNVVVCVCVRVCVTAVVSSVCRVRVESPAREE